MMLTEIAPRPVFKDPQVKVRVLQPIFVGGKAYEIGDVVSMATSDMLFSKNMCIPPRVEIL
jgi:hypothetical protein